MTADGGGAEANLSDWPSMSDITDGQDDELRKVLDVLRGLIADLEDGKATSVVVAYTEGRSSEYFWWADLNTPSVTVLGLAYQLCSCVEGACSAIPEEEA